MTKPHDVAASAGPGVQQESDPQPKAVWRFFVYSGIGIFAFFVPFQIGEKSTILLDHIVGWIQDGLGPGARYVVLALITAGAVFQIVTGRWKMGLARAIFAALSVLAVILCAMLTFGFGPEFLFEDRLGPFILDKLVVPVGLLIPVGAIFLGLLVGFGLMEFIGVLLQKFMRPVFHTPGKSAVDAVASFLGSYSLGLLITNRMYKAGAYTAKEASIVAAGFSTASATFMVVVARTLDLMHIWGVYFAVTLVVCFAVTAIVVRLPPLSTIPNEYYSGAEPEPEVQVRGKLLPEAWRQGKYFLKYADSLPKTLWRNFADGVVMTIQVLPGIMAVGVIGLTLAFYTPTFAILGAIFYPLMWVLRLPDPWFASEAVAIGLAELFLPATLVAGDGSDILRFTVAVTSISQVFFFSSMIPAVLATDIPLAIWKMVVIWFYRVVFTVLLTVPIAHLIF
ncbi:YjiH family protein [Corynebacterium propinquum]|uniref:YjiH family protein n=1 Tax=Corynebacterium propinquum TaxID=43769 RepID=UPI000377018A|nr:YjiH family protein [Corynebacterium propinquum]MDK4318990.1 YjiH family protein [Corynebacterium propinquum]PZQ25057.1 MAG: YjiH family protein [Corynebacterium propinquum]QQU91091.1 YjiH family protein [Corynebacterium propinquum]